MSNLKLPTMTISGLRKYRHGATIAYATTIEWNADKTKCGIYHHNSLIAVIDESGQTGHKRVVSVSNAGYHTRTTSQRIGAILHANTVGYYNTRIIQGIMHITCTQSHYTGGGTYDVFSGHRFISIIVNDYPMGFKGINGREQMGEGAGIIITDESLYNGIH